MEELKAWTDRYQEAMGEAALRSAELVVAELPDVVKSHAYRFCLAKNLKMEDVHAEIAVMAFTVESTIQTLYSVVQAKDEFIHELEDVGAMAQQEIRQQGREITKITDELVNRTKELGVVVKEMEIAGDAAYRNFKARVNPDEIKEKLADGALAVLTKKLSATMDESVKRAVSRNRYVVNCVCLGFFTLGCIAGKYFI